MPYEYRTHKEPPLPIRELDNSNGFEDVYIIITLNKDMRRHVIGLTLSHISGLIKQI